MSANVEEALLRLEKKMSLLERLALISTKEVLSVSEAALLMGEVSEDHIRKLTSHKDGHAPELGYSQPGGKLKFIEKTELLAYMRKNKVKGVDELNEEIKMRA